MNPNNNNFSTFPEAPLPGTYVNPSPQHPNPQQGGRRQQPSQLQQQPQQQHIYGGVGYFNQNLIPPPESLRKIMGEEKFTMATQQYHKLMSMHGRQPGSHAQQNQHVKVGMQQQNRPIQPNPDTGNNNPQYRRNQQLPVDTQNKNDNNNRPKSQKRRKVSQGAQNNNMSRQNPPAPPHAHPQHHPQQQYPQYYPHPQQQYNNPQYPQNIPIIPQNLSSTQYSQAQQAEMTQAEIQRQFQLQRQFASEQTVQGLNFGYATPVQDAYGTGNSTEYHNPQMAVHQQQPLPQHQMIYPQQPVLSHPQQLRAPSSELRRQMEYTSNRTGNFLNYGQSSPFSGTSAQMWQGQEQEMLLQQHVDLTPMALDMPYKQESVNSPSSMTPTPAPRGQVHAAPTKGGQAQGQAPSTPIERPNLAQQQQSATAAGQNTGRQASARARPQQQQMRTGAQSQQTGMRGGVQTQQQQTPQRQNTAGQEHNAPQVGSLGAHGLKENVPQEVRPVPQRSAAGSTVVSATPAPQPGQVGAARSLAQNRVHSAVPRQQTQQVATTRSTTSHRSVGPQHRAHPPTAPQQASTGGTPSSQPPDVSARPEPPESAKEIAKVIGGIWKTHERTASKGTPALPPNNANNIAAQGLARAQAKRHNQLQRQPHTPGPAQQSTRDLDDLDISTLNEEQIQRLNSSSQHLMPFPQQSATPAVTQQQTNNLDDLDISTLSEEQIARLNAPPQRPTPATPNTAQIPGNYAERIQHRQRWDAPIPKPTMPLPRHFERSAASLTPISGAVQLQGSAALKPAGMEAHKPPQAPPVGNTANQTPQRLVPQPNSGDTTISPMNAQDLDNMQRVMRKMGEEAGSPFEKLKSVTKSIASGKVAGRGNTKDARARMAKDLAKNSQLGQQLAQQPVTLERPVPSQPYAQQAQMLPLNKQPALARHHHQQQQQQQQQQRAISQQGTEPQPAQQVVAEEDSEEDLPKFSSVMIEPPKKKRGRPRKNPTAPNPLAANDPSQIKKPKKPAAPRKKATAKKQAAASIVQELESAAPVTAPDINTITSLRAEPRTPAPQVVYDLTADLTTPSPVPLRGSNVRIQNIPSPIQPTPSPGPMLPATPQTFAQPTSPTQRSVPATPRPTASPVIASPGMQNMNPMKTSTPLGAQMADDYDDFFHPDDFESPNPSFNFDQPYDPTQQNAPAYYSQLVSSPDPHALGSRSNVPVRPTMQQGAGDSFFKFDDASLVDDSNIILPQNFNRLTQMPPQRIQTVEDFNFGIFPPSTFPNSSAQQPAPTQQAIAACLSLREGPPGMYTPLTVGIPQPLQALESGYEDFMTYGGHDSLFVPKGPRTISTPGQTTSKQPLVPPAHQPQKPALNPLAAAIPYYLSGEPAPTQRFVSPADLIDRKSPSRSKSASTALNQPERSATKSQPTRKPTSTGFSPAPAHERKIAQGVHEHHRAGASNVSRELGSDYEDSMTYDGNDSLFASKANEIPNSPSVGPLPPPQQPAPTQQAAAVSPRITQQSAPTQQSAEASPAHMHGNEHAEQPSRGKKRAREENRIIQPGDPVNEVIKKLCRRAINYKPSPPPPPRPSTPPGYKYTLPPAELAKYDIEQRKKLQMRQKKREEEAKKESERRRIVERKHREKMRRVAETSMQEAMKEKYKEREAKWTFQNHERAMRRRARVTAWL